MELYGKSVFVSQESSNGYNLCIKPDDGRRVGNLKKDAFFKTIEGVDFYEYTDRIRGIPPSQLYCTCGYEGSPEVIQTNYKGFGMTGFLEVDEKAPLEKRYLYHDEHGEVRYIFTDEVVKVMTDVACPICQKNPDISLFRQKIARVLYDYRIASPIDQTKRVFEWEVLHYQAEGRNKCSIKKSKSYWEVNLQTGESVIRTEDDRVKEMDVSFGIPDYAMKHAGIECMSESADASRLLREFLQECLLIRGVRHKSIEDIVFAQGIERNWQKIDNGVHHVKFVMPFIRYPQLETMGFHFWTDMPKNIQKKMDHAAHSKISVIEALTGHRSKSVRLLVEKRKNLELAILFGRLVRDPNHLKKLLTGKETKTEASFSWHFRRLVTKNKTETESPFEWWHMNERVAFFRNLYSTEKQFVNALLKLHKSVFALSDQQDSSEENVFNFLRIHVYLEDTFNTFKKIKRKDASYQLPLQNDLLKLHDQVAKDYRKMKHVNQAIPYSKEESHLYHRTVNGYRFSLAKDTHELIDAGEEMDHCVGSYREQALSGESVIVFAFNEQGKRRLCLEVKGKERKQLMQVKLHGNRLPDAEEAAIAKKWAVLCQINTDFTHDLQACNHAEV